MTTQSSTDHATFVIERLLDASPARVFAAWADPKAKARWFAGPPEKWQERVREHDFRVGGRDRLVGAFAETGTVSAYDCTYVDIVADRRIIYTYEMHLDGRKISVSLSTVEVKPEGARTRMIYTEQGVFLDGFDDAGGRERGTLALFDRLEGSLREAHASG
jgi:uncharacterized protein YndB with AHSA1/START domain